MTTIDLAGHVAAAVALLPSAPVRLASDYRTDLQRLEAGTTYSQIRVSPAGTSKIGSNQFNTIAAVSVKLHRKLSSALDERAYTEAALQTDLAALVDEAFWRGLASVLDLFETPETVIDRVGNVVSATLTIMVILQ